MEDYDEDDLYGGPTTTNDKQQFAQHHQALNGDEQSYDDGEDGEEGEAMEDESDDSVWSDGEIRDPNTSLYTSSQDDIDIITERKPGSTKPDASKPDTTTLKPPDPSHKRQRSGSHDPTTTSHRASPPPSSRQQVSKPISARPGSDYPAIHTSTSTDPSAPTLSYALPNGTQKQLTDLDFDADLAEHTKPWRLPGTDQSDYFNYGFDEFTWATYCLKQQNMRAGIEGQKSETKAFEAMFGGGMPPGGMPGGPMAGGMPGMPPMPGGGAGGGQGQGAMQGMPDMNDPMMAQMMQQMMASGVDPSQMDFATFAQQMQGGMPGGGGPQGGMGGGMNGMGGMGGMGMGGPPQGAPAGPSGGGGQGDYGGGGRQGYGGGGRGRRRGGWH